MVQPTYLMVRSNRLTNYVHIYIYIGEAGRGRRGEGGGEREAGRGRPGGKGRKIATNRDFYTFTYITCI